MKIIYEPKGAAREYAELALNVYGGCTHACIYCYNNGRFSKKEEFFKAAKPRPGILSQVISDCRILKDKGNCPEILMTFLGDCYQPAEAIMGLTGSIIRQLIAFDLPFTILTKSSLIDRDIHILAPYRQKFRLGLSFTSVEQREVSQWEPGTGYIIDRVATLRNFKSRGVKTWISLEPVMSVKSTIGVIKDLHRWTDFFRIGALSHMDPPEPIDLIEAQRTIMQTLEFYKCKYEFKKSFTDL